MPQLEIFLFGSPQIYYSGIPIEFVRRKAVALIAYLALTNQRQSRDVLAEFLWPDNDSVRSRASLRRVLSTISETPLSPWIDADRETIVLHQDENLWIDVRQFNELLAQPVLPESLTQALALYRGHFMAGFTLRDSAAFDHWQSAQMQNLQQKLFAAFDQLVSYHIHHNQPDRAIPLLRQQLSFDPLIETAQYQLMEIYARTGQRGMAIAQYDSYATLLENELGILPQVETRQLYEQIRTEQSTVSQTLKATIRGNLPSLPSLVIGREQTVSQIKHRLNVATEGADNTANVVENAAISPQVILQGWPGIGKTTLSSVIAHDREVHRHYHDGILWTSLGQHPNLSAILAGWGQALGFSDLEKAQNLEEASTRLTAFLQDKQVLIILDDVWSIEHTQPLRIGGQKSGLLVTTRLNELARVLASRPESIYKIPILSVDESVNLLRTLAPQVVKQYPHETYELASDLEGLPLALQVAGRLLHAEMEMGWGITDLLAELRHGKRLMEAQAPADRFELTNETTPTIATLLQRSVERLSTEMQERFALLGVFAPKPATFSLAALEAVWETGDVRPTVRLFVDRGLLEPARSGHFQMHALLVLLAKSMFEELED